jgi:hypothetical protein
MDAKILNKKWHTEYNNFSESHSPRPSQLHPRDAGMVQHMQINKSNQHINRSKDKNKLIISINVEKAFDKIHTIS